MSDTLQDLLRKPVVNPFNQDTAIVDNKIISQPQQIQIPRRVGEDRRQSIMPQNQEVNVSQTQTINPVTQQQELVKVSQTQQQIRESQERQQQRLQLEQISRQYWTMPVSERAGFLRSLNPPDTRQSIDTSKMQSVDERARLRNELLSGRLEDVKNVGDRYTQTFEEIRRKAIETGHLEKILSINAKTEEEFKRVIPEDIQKIGTGAALGFASRLPPVAIGLGIAGAATVVGEPYYKFFIGSISKTEAEKQIKENIAKATTEMFTPEGLAFAATSGMFIGGIKSIANKITGKIESGLAKKYPEIAKKTDWTVGQELEPSKILTGKELSGGVSKTFLERQTGKAQGFIEIKNNPLMQTEPKPFIKLSYKPEIQRIEPSIVAENILKGANAEKGEFLIKSVREVGGLQKIGYGIGSGKEIIAFPKIKDYVSHQPIDITFFKEKSISSDILVKRITGAKGEERYVVVSTSNIVNKGKPFTKEIQHLKYEPIKKYYQPEWNKRLIFDEPVKSRTINAKRVSFEEVKLGKKGYGSAIAEHKFKRIGLSERDIPSQFYDTKFGQRILNKLGLKGKQTMKTTEDVTIDTVSKGFIKNKNIVGTKYGAIRSNAYRLAEADKKLGLVKKPSGSRQAKPLKLDQFGQVDLDRNLASIKIEDFSKKPVVNLERELRIEQSKLALGAATAESISPTVNDFRKWKENIQIDEAQEGFIRYPPTTPVNMINPMRNLDITPNRRKSIVDEAKNIGKIGEFKPSNMRFNFNTISKEGLRFDTKQLLRSETRLKEESKLDEKGMTFQDTFLGTGEIEKIGQKQRGMLKLGSKQDLETKQTIEYPPITEIRTIIDTTPHTTGGFSFGSLGKGFLSKSSLKVEGKPSYTVEIRRGGKFKPIAYGLPKGKGLQFGSERASKTLGQTFRLRKTGMTFANDINFQPSSKIFTKPRKKTAELEFVERRGMTLKHGTGEIKEIQLARKHSKKQGGMRY